MRQEIPRHGRARSSSQLCLKGKQTMTNYYCKADVLSGGDITNPDNPVSVKQAFSATSAVHGGDTLFIRGGLLKSCSTVLACSGEQDNPIYIQPYPGECFIFDSYIPFAIKACAAADKTLYYDGPAPSGLVSAKEIMMEVNTPRAEISQMSGGVSGG